MKTSERAQLLRASGL